MPNTNLDLYALVNRMLPVGLRQPRLVYYMVALMAPLRDLFALFGGLVRTARYQIAINATVLQLQRVLNDRLDPGLRRIRIENPGAGLARTTLFLDFEQQPDTELLLDSETSPGGPHELFSDADYSSQVDFVVVLPGSFPPFPLGTPPESSQQFIELSGLIEKYKFAGMLWTYRVTNNSSI